MTFHDHATVSDDVKHQISEVVNVWANHLESSLVGVYVHGSLALKHFVEGVSDIDVLIVTDRNIGREERLSIAQDIIALDGNPSPLEMSAIWLKDLVPWRYPTPCQFHYSDTWTEPYRQMLCGEIQQHFIIDEDFPDEDIACHVRLTCQSGLCVYGKPISEVFPTVPEEDFWHSISNGIAQYAFDAHHPRYFASNILLLGRVLSYKVEKRILSKHDGALWTMRHVPERFRHLLELAWHAWYEGAAMEPYDEVELEALRQWLIAEILS